MDKLTASDGATGDLFGWSIDVDGDRMVISSREDDDMGTNSGSAYIFEYNSSSASWSEQAKLTASDGDEGDGFSYGVALSGNRVVIGSFGDDDRNTDAGAVYVFEYDMNIASWNSGIKLLASDGGAGDYFGGTVSMEGDRIVVSADAHDGNGIDAGAVYVFEYINDEWTQTNKLTPTDIAAGDRFGWPVSLQGDRLAVGSFFDDDQGGQSGAAYIISLPALDPPSGAAKTVSSNQTNSISFALDANYPNPFNPSTTIAYHLPEAGQVELAIFNVVGQKVTTLVSDTQQSGRYTVQWDARGLANGVYFYRLQTDEFSQTRQMTLLK